MNFKSALLWSSLVWLGMVGLSVWAWDKLPPGPIATHFNLAGQADGFSDPWVGLTILPVLTLLVVAMLAFTPQIEPRRTHLEASAQAYQVVWVGTVGILGVSHGLLILHSFNPTLNTTVPIMVVLGGLFIAMGNYLGKVRSNFMFGVRTPWTLTSERSWNRTHRLAGWLFVGFGVVLAGVALTGPTVLLGWTLGLGLAVTTLVPLAYSYWVWRGDESRIS